MLKLKNLGFTAPGFHRPILNNINLEVHPGDFIVLIGGNGCGKSSLLKLINGLYLPTSGSILFENKDLESVSIEKRSQSISTLTQDLAFSSFSNLTVKENCDLVCIKEQKELLEEKELISYLKQFHQGLKAALHTRTKNLSGGQRQALALAMVLMHPPKLLLLDEHTSALDPKTGHNIMNLTSDLISKNSITTIMITHEMDDALSYGNRLIALKEGQLIFEADAKTKATLTKEDLLHLCY